MAILIEVWRGRISIFVMPGFMPGIHVFLRGPKDVDGRDKPGHDDYWRSRPCAFGQAGHAGAPSICDRRSAWWLVTSASITSSSAVPSITASSL